jgi:ankyrin repeat protein
MDRPSDDEFRSYFDAAAKGDAAGIQSFVRRYPPMIDERPWFTDTTALREAASCGQRQIMTLLLDLGADIDKSDSVNYTTPLMRAPNRDCAILLLDRGADMEAQDRLGQTALVNFASTGRNDMIELLLDRGADIHAGHRRGFTALRVAAHYGYAETVELLLERGALEDLNRQDAMKYTPLMWAANCGSAKMVRTLLSFGALTDLKNDDGETAVDIAKRRGYDDIAAVIDKGMPLRKLPGPPAKKPAPETRDVAFERLKQRAPDSFHLKPRPPKA